MFRDQCKSNKHLFISRLHKLFFSDRGDCFFYGHDAPITSMWQTIDLTNYADPVVIDSSTLRFNLSAWLGGYDSQNDKASVSLRYIDQANQTIGSMVTIGPVTDTNRGNQASFLFRQATGLVPIGSRSLVVTLVIDRSLGPINDGYADNIAVYLYI